MGPLPLDRSALPFMSTLLSLLLGILFLLLPSFVLDSVETHHSTVDIPEVVKLCYYAHVGNLDMVKQIIETGLVNVNEVDYSDRTALHAAAAAGHPEIVQYLVEQGADRSIQDSWGITPIGKYVSLSSSSFTLISYPFPAIEGH